MTTVLVTGSAGLVGSACVRHFAALGRRVVGLDSNARRDFFGPDGDTRPNLRALRADVPGYAHHKADVRDRAALAKLVRRHRPGLVIHAAAQPSHDLAAARPFDDFEANALGTLNLLEACRQHAPEAAFCFLSTNKVYGDAPNEIELEDAGSRFEPAREADRGGIGEGMRLDHCTHSLFGCSKLAADVLVQEYGRNLGLPTVCFRAGCLTGGAHAAAQQHGFLAYLARCVREGRPYTVFGHQGKQVRDNLHAADVARACEAFAANPGQGAVYNLGGGRANSVSVLEAIRACEDAAGKKLSWGYREQPRTGDHRWYISDTSRFEKDYPEWSVTVGLQQIIEELCTQP